MCDSRKTKKTLLEELKTLRSRAAELERIEAEHKKVEQKLKQYQFMVESAHDVIFFKDLNSRYVIANDKTLEAFGLSREQVIGKNDYEIMPQKAEAGKNIEDDKLVFETGKPTEIIKHMTGSDGKERWFQAIKVPQFDNNGNIIGLIGIARDVTTLKQAEEEMTASEERFSGLAERSFDMIFMTDAQGYLTYISAASERIFHYKPQEMVGTHFKNYLIKSEIPRVSQRFAENMQGRNLGILPMEAIRKDGSRVFVELNSSPILKDGETIGMQGIIRDITERKKAGRELLFKSTLLEAQSETSIDGILVVDSEGKSISFNNNFGRMWNIPQQILDTRDDEKMLQYVLDQLKNPEQFLEKVRYLYAHKNEKSRDEIQFKDGRVFDRYSSPLLDSNDKYYGRVWYFRNITERKRADEALRESEEKFRTFMETASDLMHITDKDGNFTYVNDAMVRTLGYSKDEMIGMHLTEVLSKEGAKKDFGRKLQELVTTGEIDIESVWLTKDGKEIYGQTKVVAVYDRDGNFAGGRGILRDITERKRAEDELQQARDELEIRVVQRTADLAGVNKELRNEITERKKAEEKLLIYQKQLRSLASELSLAEERLRRRIATNVHDHVGQNLAISKIKIESLRESAASPELAEDLEEIRDLISQTIESTRSLTFELSPPVLYELGFEAAVEWLVRQTRQQHGLSADFKADGQTKPLDNNVRVLLFQAVRELLVNVVKHAQAHNVTVSTRRVGNEIRVSVEDDGVGFDVSQAGSHDYKTGGFGLFSIRERLGHIGGRLEVESKPGLGTRVTLTAPIDQESQNSGEGRK